MCVGSCDELLDQSWIEWIFNRSLWISRQTLSSLPTEITIFQKKVKKSTLLLPVSAFASDPPISTIHSDSDAAGSACKLSGDKQSYDKDWNDYLKTIDLVPLITTFGYYEQVDFFSQNTSDWHQWIVQIQRVLLTTSTCLWIKLLVVRGTQCILRHSSCSVVQT